MSQEANLSVGRDSKRLQLTADASRRTDDQRHPPVDGANGLNALMMCGMESAEEVAAPCMMFFQWVLLLVLCILRLYCHDAEVINSDGDKLSQLPARRIAEEGEEQKRVPPVELIASLGSFLSVRVAAMSILPPIQQDHVITRLPRPFKREAVLHGQDDFDHLVKQACEKQRAGSEQFKISKVIVVGDLAVGKTCLINRFCKHVFDRNYKGTIGVDFEMEQFRVLGVPFTLQLWDTSGQERYKCIASTYYRGAQVVIIAFDVNNIGSLSHAKQWLKDSLQYNDPTAVQLFLVGTKKDLSSPAQYSQMECDALELAQEISAEYWAVSSLTGENVNEFFFRVASLAFENSVLAEMRESGSTSRIGEVISISGDFGRSSKKKRSSCCQ